jgi:hypothetical protein
MNPRASVSALGALSIFSLAMSVTAQSPRLTISGNAAGDRSGQAVQGAGDVNGDGYDDLIVGAPASDAGGLPGSARVLSGLDGSVIHSWTGSPDDLFGASVAGAGDVNGDGLADVIVGVPNDGTGGTAAGRAIVFSGADGSVLWSFDGAAGDRLGAAVNGAGDVNGDGYDDFIVGAPLHAGVGAGSGQVHVYSGVDGTELWLLDGVAASDNFGWSVAGAGDLDGDCHDDFLVGAPLVTTGAGVGAGQTQVFSGATGGVLWTFDGAVADGHAGWSVAGAGDVNRDGVPDIVVGAPLASTNGAVSIWSGADGTLIRTTSGDAAADQYGWSVAGAGDVNADGYADVIIGAPMRDSFGKTDSGQAQVCSGADGARLLTLWGSNASDNLGFSVCGCGDTDGDGRPDLLVGVPRADATGTDAGTALVYAARDPYVTHAQAAVVAPAAATNAQYGARMRRISDINNDGVLDYIIGSPFDVARFGTAWVYSGADHSFIRKHTGPIFDSWYGIRMGSVGDLDDDGVIDYGIGAFHDDSGANDAGGLYIYSGATGSLIKTLLGATTLEHLGSGIAMLGDVNGDGTDDFVVASGEFDGLKGKFAVKSGADYSTIYEKFGTAAGQAFGWEVGAVRDLDGDGITDFVVGAHYGQSNPPGTGYANVYSGDSGDLIWHWEGVASQDRFGWNVASVGDVNADGFDDIAVGADGGDPNGVTSAGYVRVFSGKTGAMLYDLHGPEMGASLGIYVDAAGDVNGDGYADFVASAPTGDPGGLMNAGYAFVYSGLDGSILQTFTGTNALDDLGRSITGTLHDGDGDGYPDIIVGVARDDTAGTDRGAARIMTSVAKTDPPFFKIYGAACAGTNGHLPRIGFTNRPALSETFDVRLTSAPENAAAFLGVDIQASSINLGIVGAPECTLNVLPLIAVGFNTDAMGKVSLPFPLPADTVVLGVSLYMQWLIADPTANNLGLVMTRGGRFTIGNQ